jgi:hypothetical protein
MATTKLKLKKEKFQEFLSIIKNISKISNTANDYRIKIKFNKEKLLIYTVLGTKSIAHLFKSYTLFTEDYIENFEEVEDCQFIIKHSNKFVKQFGMLDCSKGILMEVESKEDNRTLMVRRVKIRDKTLKLTFTGDHLNTMLDLNIEDIESYCNVDDSLLQFKLTTDNYTKIKNLSTIHDNKTLNITVSKNKISFGETSKWDLVVDEVETEDRDIAFPKKLFSCITFENDFIDVYVYESFLLFKESNNYLMISLEQTWSDGIEYEMES